MARRGNGPQKGYNPAPRTDTFATQILNNESSLLPTTTDASSLIVSAAPPAQPTPYPGSFNSYLTDYVSQLRKKTGRNQNIGVQQDEYDKARAAFDLGLGPQDAVLRELSSIPREEKLAILRNASNQGQDVTGLVGDLFPSVREAAPLTAPTPLPPSPLPVSTPAPVLPPAPIEYVRPKEQLYPSILPLSPIPLSLASIPSPQLPAPTAIPSPQLPVPTASIIPSPSIQPTFPEVATGSKSALFNPAIPANLPEQVRTPIEEKPIFGLNPAEEAAALKREAELEQRANAEALQSYLAQEEANAPLNVRAYADLFQPAVERSIRKGAGLFAAQGLGSGGFEGSGAIQELVRKAAEESSQEATRQALDQLLNARSRANLLGLQNSQLPALFRQQALTRGLEGRDIESERAFDKSLADLAANTQSNAQRTRTRRSKYGSVGSILGGGLGYLTGGPLGGLFGSKAGEALGGLF